MREYHIYCVDDQNRVVSRHDPVVEDDLAALEKAREICENMKSKSGKVRAW